MHQSSSDLVKMLSMSVSTCKYLLCDSYLRCSGLFAPSAGQHFRDEQRRRRSQYDRGTSLAERDEYYDEGLYIGYPNCKLCKNPQMDIA